MREQPDPVRLIVQLGAIAVLLATVALSVGSLRDIPVESERFNRRLFLGLDQETSRAAATNILTTPSQPSSDDNKADAGRPTASQLPKD